MSREPFVFLTDTAPRRWRLPDLCWPAQLVAEEHTPAARAWFRAANGLGLALARSGGMQEAADLMETAIGLANNLAADAPDLIGLGVESWINRVDLLRHDDPDGAARALRSCYALAAGRSAAREHTFGLHVGRLNDAGHDVAIHALSILRNRSQVGLLKNLLDRGRVRDACAFASTVVADFPRSVAAGMLHAVEVLAAYEPAHPFLRPFDVRAPRTEGDFLVWLWTLGPGTPHDGGSRLAFDDFGFALAGWGARETLRNPRTPLLWAVHAALASDACRSAVLNAVTTVVAACVEQSDLHTYRAVRSLVDRRLCLDGLPRVLDAAPDVEPRSLVSPLVDAARRVDREGAAKSFR